MEEEGGKHLNESMRRFGQTTLQRRHLGNVRNELLKYLTELQQKVSY